MISGDWKAVWDAAMVAYGHQPIEMRVGMALAAAFLVLMVLEGLRASFLPRRTVPAAAREAEATPQPAAPVPAPCKPAPAKPQARIPMRAFAPAYGMAHQMAAPATRRAMPATRKRETTRPRPYRSPRPKIRRAAAAIHGEQSDSLS